MSSEPIARDSAYAQSKGPPFAQAFARFSSRKLRSFGWMSKPFGTVVSAFTIFARLFFGTAVSTGACE